MSLPRAAAEHRTVVVAVLGVAGAMIVAAGLAAPADRDTAVTEEWTRLLDCIVGVSSRATRVDIARRARYVELHHLTHANAPQGESARREWLSQCAIAATRLDALLKHEHVREFDDPWRSLREAIDEIRGALESERLPSPDLLRAALDAAERLKIVPTSAAGARDGYAEHVPLLNMESLPRDPDEARAYRGPFANP